MFLKLNYRSDLANDMISFKVKVLPSTKIIFIVVKLESLPKLKV